MTYEYQCQDDACKYVQELILASHNDRPEWKKCPACGGRSVQVVLSAPAISTQGSDNASFDVAIGRDAAARWESIHARQAKRDKVRRESGATGLTMTGFNEFKPLPADRQLTMVKGLKAKSDTPGDAKLVKNGL